METLSLSLSLSGHQMEFTNSQHDHFCASQHDAYPALAACSPEMAGFLSTPCLNKNADIGWEIKSFVIFI